MSNPRRKAFDCVQSMRQIRDRISKEIGTMNHDELMLWLRSHRYANPLLKRLAERAAGEAASANRPLPRR
jgi:hypothetical protein